MARDSTHPMHLPKSTVHTESARRGCVQIQSAGRLSADCWVCLVSEFVLGLARVESSTYCLQQCLSTTATVSRKVRRPCKPFYIKIGLAAVPSLRLA